MSEQLTVEKVKDNHERVLRLGYGPNHEGCVKVVGFLLSQLATIERDTAEKAAELACENVKGDTIGEVKLKGYISLKIRDHFNLGEKP